MDKIELQAAVKSAESTLSAAVAALEAFDQLPENNVYPSLDEAAGALEDKMRGWASDACEGSYNCGNDIYEQEFIVDGKHYIGELKVEYNRHDKTYYYIEEAEFSYTEKP